MKKRLHIGMFVTSQRALPTPKDVIFAPVDLAIEIADKLKPEGFRFTFYAPPSPKLGHAVVSGDLEQGAASKEYLRPYKRKWVGPNVLWMRDQYLLGLAMEDARKGKIDVLHSHMVEHTSPLLRYAKVPTVITLHDPMGPMTAETLELFNDRRMRLVSISNAQRRPNPHLGYVETIYNGVDTDLFSYGMKPKDEFLFAGRVMKKKGVADAIKAAKLANARLRIVGKYYDEKFFKKEVKAKLTKSVTYHRAVSRKKLPDFYRRAKALLMPIKWEEPFGLVMAEAMSCGTPVIAYGRGSVPEIIEHGKTGFIVRGPKEMANAMKKIHMIDRAACRRHVEKYFSLERMAEKYGRLYRRYARR